MEPLRSYEEVVNFILDAEMTEKDKKDLLKHFKIKHEEEIVSEKVRQRHLRTKNGLKAII